MDAFSLEARESLTVESIIYLYKKYAEDLRRTFKQQAEFNRKFNLRWYQRRFLNVLLYLNENYKVRTKLNTGEKAETMPPSFNDLEAEITYLLIREFKPENIFEISPGSGWSSSWILSALKDNKYGFLTSFDMVDDSKRILLPELTDNRWKLVVGDIKQKEKDFSSNIDYLFLDSAHSADMAEWYIRHIFPFVRSGAPVSIHDIYVRKEVYGEIPVVQKWFKDKGISFITPSKYAPQSLSIRRRLVEARRNVGLTEFISTTKVDPSVFFLMR
jgi:predicted O-methyltransferase YrrM